MKIIKNLSFKRKLFFIIVIFALLPFLIATPIYFVDSWNKNISRSIEKYENEMNNAIAGFNNMLYLYKLHLTYIKSHPDLETILTADINENYQLLVLSYMSFRDDMLKLAVNDMYASSINIYTFLDDAYDSQFSQSMELLDDDFVENIINKDKTEVVSRYIEIADNTSPYTEYLCLYDNVQNITTPLGIVEIRIPLANAANGFEFDVPENGFTIFLPSAAGDYAVLNKNNISDTAVREITSEFLSAGAAADYTAIPAVSRYTNDSFVLFVPASYIYSDAIGFLARNLIIIALLVLVVLFSIRFSTGRITARLTALVEQISINFEDTISRNEFKLLGGNDEFSVIDAKFYELVGSINNYYKKLADYETEKNMLKLMLLQERINPHFLYNTLSSIKWAYPDCGLNYIVDSLVKYYRIALNKGNEILAVNQEMDLIEAYIKIQKFAYKSDFLFAFEITDEIKELKIIKHILQPIVENSVMHGLIPLEAGGKLTITGTLEADKIKISIKDNGMGMREETVSQLLTCSYQSIQGGYGLKNVIKRLDMFYKNDYKISIISSPGNGTCVTLELPAEPAYIIS